MGRWQDAHAANTMGATSRVKVGAAGGACDAGTPGTAAQMAASTPSAAHAVGTRLIHKVRIGSGWYASRSAQHQRHFWR